MGLSHKQSGWISLGQTSQWGEGWAFSRALEIWSWLICPCPPGSCSILPPTQALNLDTVERCLGVGVTHTAQVCSCSGSSMCILWPWADCRGQEAQLFYPWNVDHGSNPLLRITVQIRWAAPFREPSLESLLRHHIIPSCVFSLLLSPAHYFSSNASSHYSSRYWFSSSSATRYLDHSFWLPPC